jgi:tyrosine-protein phosphatase YwqE
LGTFYAEAAPKPNQSRAKQMAAEQANEYTKNSFKSIRSPINRHCQDLGRDIDIVRGKEFRVSNNILDGKLKKNLQEGVDATLPILSFCVMCKFHIFIPIFVSFNDERVHFQLLMKF